MRKIEWSDGDIKFLKQNYGNKPAVAIAEHLGIDLSRVYTKASQLGLKKIGINKNCVDLKDEAPPLEPSVPVFIEKSVAKKPQIKESNRSLEEPVSHDFGKIREHLLGALDGLVSKRISVNRARTILDVTQAIIDTSHVELDFRKKSCELFTDFIRNQENKPEKNFSKPAEHPWRELGNSEKTSRKSEESIANKTSEPKDMPTGKMGSLFASAANLNIPDIGTVRRHVTT